MDEKTFKDRVARLTEVSKIIENLPVEIRSLSFPLLEGYIVGKDSEKVYKLRPPEENKLGSFSNNEDYATRDEFLASHNHDKPSDNVYLLIAALYRDFGTEPFSIKELQSLATDTGVTIPERADMTIKQATANGKYLFTSTSRGYYKPTVHGEAFLKETYEISKGTKRKTTIESEQEGKSNSSHGTTRKTVKSVPSKKSSKGSSKGVYEIITEFANGDLGKTFLTEVKKYIIPASHQKKITLFIQIMEKISIKNITVNHVFTCYRLLKEPTPLSINQAIIDAKNKNMWLINDSWQDLKTHHKGLEMIEHNLMPKENKK